MPKGIYEHAKGEKCHNWKGGKPKCLSCGKEVSNHNNKRCMKCAHKKNLNPRWNGGIWKNQDGYILLLMKNHPFANCRGYIMEHRVVMENKIGRYLKKGEVVHHHNGDVADNRIDNLELFSSIGKHLKHHAILRKGVKNEIFKYRNKKTIREGRQDHNQVAKLWDASC